MKSEQNKSQILIFHVRNVGFISYYWFLRDILLSDLFDEQNLNNFLIKFEEWREIQKHRFETGKNVHNKYVEFESLLSEGWLDSASLKGRHAILVDFYHDFLLKGKFGDVDDTSGV